jgi:hypothetical protein
MGEGKEKYPPGRVFIFWLRGAVIEQITADSLRK